MVTDKDIERAMRNRDFEEEGSLLPEGASSPKLGPSDSSDSGSDVPPELPDTDSDRQNTGDRPTVENTGEAPLDEDIEADAIVPADRAGLAHTPPDPAVNGGVDDDDEDDPRYIRSQN